MGVLFLGVPYYIGDPKRDPNLEKYPRGFRAPLEDTIRVPVRDLY